MTSSATPIRPVEEKPVAARARARALLMLDPLLMVAAIGVVACSLVTLHVAARGQVPGPSFYVERQAIYAVAGLIIAIGLALVDYSLLRRFRYVLYTVMIGLNLVVLGMPAVNGGHRWIPLPLFEFQSSEFGKILLIVSLGAFLVERARRLQEWRTTLRIMLLALLPAAIVIAQPDLGTALVYIVVGFTVLFVAGTSWK
ncbi:MAG TPA: FtsW/RodA/SpoVE family cell cycle protein, partial [Solirubrobacteraceae bacterium]|nr:FtsW/RodA/SpoVE family cell cycle protein [Solirubrobacteraceae bacterium]